MTRMLVLFNCLLMFMFSTCYAFDNNTRVAFYYGANPPLEELLAFEVVIVTPQKDLNPKLYNSASSQLYAYVNVGEVDEKSDEIGQIDPSWIKGLNPAWGSKILDMANPDWRDYLLNKKITPLWESSYRGFFLDTLDSYHLLKLDPTQIQQQQAGIIDLIKRIKAKYPDASIITNRGFEVLDSIHNSIDAVAAESLFAAWNSKAQKYETVSEKDRKWLLDKLNNTRKAYNLPVIVIDYVEPTEQEKGRETAKKISDLGFIPWVADSNLKTIGLNIESTSSGLEPVSRDILTINSGSVTKISGAQEIVPRKILLLYNETPQILQNRATSIPSFLYGAFPLQFMGFVPVLQPVNSTLPNQLSKEYAGIIAWFEKPVIKNHELLEGWLTKQVRAGIPVVFMQNFGLPRSSHLLTCLGIKYGPSPTLVKNIKISKKDKNIGYEVLPQPVATDFEAITNKEAKVLLKITAGKLQEDAITITPWGGYVLSPFDMVVLPDTKSRWVINPFLYFREALRLPLFPIPDITTANGKRILTAHIDGDAFISRVTWLDNKFTGEVILDDILKRYKIPTTVSFIQREFEILDKNEYLTKRLSDVAKQIFRLPWVQLATHTYSHPLAWGELVEGQPSTKALSYPLKDYLFSYKKEIAGSSEFINSKLAPSNKKVRVVFWSGDGNLQDKPLEVAVEAGLRNINGMSEMDLKKDPSLTNVSAFGIGYGRYYQIFAPIPNEYEYTDEWSQPLYAFQNAIHTFELTDKPVRFKPLSIYYHFYSATDQAALRALKRVYDWTLKQNYIPLYITEYIDKVVDFNNTVIAKDTSKGSDSWYIYNNKSLREFRWPVKSPRTFPDLEKSENVIGFSIHNNDLYIHLGPLDTSRISFTQSAPTRPYLVEANAEVLSWDLTDKNKIVFSLKGYVPLSFKLANMGSCQLEQDNQPLKVADYNSNIKQEASSGRFEIHCQGTVKD
ncbi:MAG: endo alpha-1,4 polygalactosaminidase [Tatlockia sp.]|nr:endo alpha-1,4 polygalactosaminidase [Tatlockia sp.]